MTNADKLGIVHGLDKLVNVSPAAALVVAWIITPGLFYLIGIVGESRIAPVWKHQYRSFMPGDLFLGVLFACAVALLKYLPASSGHWYQARAWHIAIVLVVIVAAIVMTMFVEVGAYPTRALYSPTKIYHNVVLYVGYGFLLAVVAIPAVFMTPWSGSTIIGLKAVALGSLLVWVGLIAYDNTHDPALKAHYAHVADWEPLNWRH